MEHAVDAYDDEGEQLRQRLGNRNYRDRASDYDRFIGDSRSKLRHFHELRQSLEKDAKSVGTTEPGSGVNSEPEDEFLNDLLTETLGNRPARPSAGPQEGSRVGKTVSAWISALQPEVDRDVFTARLQEKRKPSRPGSTAGSSSKPEVPVSSKLPRSTRTVEQRVANARARAARNETVEEPPRAAERHFLPASDADYHDALNYLSQVYGGLWPPRRTNQKRPPYAHFANQLKNPTIGPPRVAPRVVHTTPATVVRTVVTQTPVNWKMPKESEEKVAQKPKSNADLKPAFAIRAPRQNETVAKAPPAAAQSPPPAAPPAPKRREPYLVMQELPGVTIEPRQQPVPDSPKRNDAVRKERSVQVQQNDIPNKVVRFGKQVQASEYSHKALQSDDLPDFADEDYQTDPIDNRSYATQTRDYDRPLPVPYSEPDYDPDDDLRHVDGLQLDGRARAAKPSPQRFSGPSRFDAKQADRNAAEQRLMDAIERELVKQLTSSNERPRADDTDKDAELARVLMEHELGSLIRNMLPRAEAPPRRMPMEQSVRTPVPTPPPIPPSQPLSYSDEFDEPSDSVHQPPKQRPARFAGSPPRTPEQTESMRDEPDVPSTPLASLSESPRKPAPKVDQEAMTTIAPKQVHVQQTQTADDRVPSQPLDAPEPESYYSSPTHSHSEATETIGELVTEGQLLISAASVGERVEGLLANLRDADLMELERALGTGTETSLADLADDDETSAADDLRSEGEAARPRGPSRRERRALELLLELHERGPRIAASHVPGTETQEPQRALPPRISVSRLDSAPSAASRTPTSLSTGQLVISAAQKAGRFGNGHVPERDFGQDTLGPAAGTGSFAFSTSALSDSNAPDAEDPESDVARPQDSDSSPPSRTADRPPQLLPATRVIRIRPVEESADDNTIGVAESALVRGSQRTADVDGSVASFDDE